MLHQIRAQKVRRSAHRCSNKNKRHEIPRAEVAIFRSEQNKKNRVGGENNEKQKRKASFIFSFIEISDVLKRTKGSMHIFRRGHIQKAQI